MKFHSPLRVRASDKVLLKIMLAFRRESFRKFPAGMRQGVRFLNFSYTEENQIPVPEVA